MRIWALEIAKPLAEYLSVTASLTRVNLPNSPTRCLDGLPALQSLAHLISLNVCKNGIGIVQGQALAMAAVPR